MKKKIALLGAVALLVSSFDQGLLLAAEQETDTQLVDVQDEEIFTGSIQKHPAHLLVQYSFLIRMSRL